ncbi:phage tail protein I [Mailhella massiliensis]|uniref:phage tail protein I n=1 Tax=Mailhella massiliensis TaxID=1903261 RepID=UPI00097D14A8|nr:phage tail protein I [Mailhella massiliensis]
MKTLDDIRLSDVLPDSIARDAKVSAAATAIDPYLAAVASGRELPAIYASLSRLTGAQLDHIAKQWDVSVWRETWTDDVKRSVLSTAIIDKRKKGTVSAVKGALASISSIATIREWWQESPKGTPHTFTVYATLSDIDGSLDTETQEDLFALIDDNKPLRSHYEFVLQHMGLGQIGMVGAARPLVFAKLYNK